MFVRASFRYWGIIIRHGILITSLSRTAGLTHGLQVIEGLHRAGVEFRSLSEDFDTATATGKLQLTMVLAFSEWWRNSIRERSVAGQAKARAEGRFPSKGEHLAGKHACEGEVLPGEPVESPASRTARITRHG